jgi:catechol 2,3-dioxygenase-like lactoylglutathione lyase family enzyme
MIDHISIAVADLREARAFYDAIFAALGVPKIGEDAGWLSYGLRADASHPERAYVSIRQTSTLLPSDVRHWAFKAPSRAAVDAFWAAGLAAGGADDGPPGLRPHYHEHYYAAFLRDPSGNRIEAVRHQRPP